MNFVNRIAEIASVKQFLDSNSNVLIIESYESSGLTSFLKKIKANFAKKYYGIYVESNKYKSLGDLISDVILTRENCVKIQKIEKQLIDGNGNTPQQLLQFISFLLDGIIPSSWNTNNIVYSGYCKTIFEELLPHIVKDLQGEKETVLIIDSSQNIDERAFDTILHLCFNVIGIKIILGFNKEKKRKKLIKFKNYITSIPYIQTKNIIFAKPCFDMIKLMVRDKGLNLLDKQITALIKASNDSLHYVVYELEKMNSADYSLLNLCDKTILSILDIADLGLKKDDLNMILSSLLPFTTDNEIAKSINKLDYEKIILNDDDFISLTSKKYLNLLNVSLTLAEVTLYSDKIYRVLSKKDKITVNECLLLYHLCKYTLQNNSIFTYARKLLEYKLRIGDEINNQLINDVKFNKSSNDDCELATLTFCQLKKYKESYKWLLRIKKLSSDYLNLRAALLNRLRCHSLAETELLSRIKEENDAEKINLLLAYLISNCLHSNNISLAVSIWDDYGQQQRGIKNYGYFARNMISVGIPKINFYQIALDSFKSNNDMFGYYTTQCNAAAKLCSTDVDESIRIYNDIIPSLENYGVHHLNILYNNLGIALTMKGLYNEALKQYQAARVLSTGEMATIFITINMAIAYVMLGNRPDALKIIRELENEVIEHPVDRVAQMYYPNRILIEFINGNYDVDSLIVKIIQHPDRHNIFESEQLTKNYMRIAEKSDFDKNEMMDLWKPCYLAYWYIDPLKFISEMRNNEILTI